MFQLFLNNFVMEPTYKRCGKKFNEQYYNNSEADDYYDSYHNFADSGLNASLDSIQSAE